MTIHHVSMYRYIECSRVRETTMNILAIEKIELPQATIYLKAHKQAKIIKKSLILVWLLTMTI